MTTVGVKTQAVTKHQDQEDVAPDAPAHVTISIGRLGRKLDSLSVPVGTTLGEVISSQKLQKSEIRLRGKNMPSDTILEEGDFVIVAPPAIVGG